MKLAVSQIAWQKDEEAKAFSLLQKHGYSGLEIAPTIAVGQAPYDKPQEIAAFSKSLKQGYNLDICSMQSLWYGQAGSIFGAEAAALLEYTKKAVLFAKTGGIKNLVFGCPKNRNKPENETDEKAITFFKQAADFAHEHSCTFAIEPNPPIYGTNFLNTSAEALAMIEAVNSPGCTLNLDFGTIIENGEDIALFEKHVNKISHVHISEPNLVPVKQREQHRQLAQLLSSNNYSGYVSIEAKAMPLEELEAIMLYVKEVFG